jgi:nitroreductase
MNKGRAEVQMPIDDAELRDALLDLLATRRSVGAAQLSEPGPSQAQIRQLLSIASRVPDHGALQPWRFILVEGEARQALCDRLLPVLDEAFVEAEERARMQQKVRMLFTSAPLIVIVVSLADSAARIPEWEQILSAGAVCMTLTVAARALGFSSNWLSGWASYDQRALAILGLSAAERIAGIVPIGTAKEQPADRPRPELDAIVKQWR